MAQLRRTASNLYGDTSVASAHHAARQAADERLHSDRHRELRRLEQSRQLDAGEQSGLANREGLAEIEQ